MKAHDCIDSYVESLRYLLNKRHAREAKENRLTKTGDKINLPVCGNRNNIQSTYIHSPNGFRIFVTSPDY